MTKLYLHREGVGTLPSGTLPSSEQSSLTADANLFDNEDGSENRVMNTTISAQAQTSATNTSTGDTSAHNYYIMRWVSPKIYQPSVSAQTWNVKTAMSESNAAANFPRSSTGVMYVNAYVWKPSDGTKIGTILDGNSAADGEEAGTSQTLIEYTFTGAAVTGITPGDAVIVFEMWAIVTQGNGTQRTQTVFYDGTTESSTSNNASFIETPEDINFTETKGYMTSINASASGAVSTANTTQYLPIIGNLEFTTTEDTVETVFRKSGTLSRLGVRLTANTITGNTTFTIRKNGSDTSLVCTFGSSATGYQQDNTNTVSVAEGDTINLETTPGGATNTFTIKDLIVHFEADDGTTTHILGSSQANNLTSASATRYMPISGRSVATATENDAEVEQRVAGTYSKFQVYVSSNARTTSTTFKSRKNNGDGNLTVTVGAGATGLFEDTSNSDTVASGDDYNFAATTGSGTETLTYTILKVEFAPTTAGKGVTPANNIGSSNVQNANVTQYYSVGGATIPLNTEADYKRRFKHSKITFTEMHIWLSSNTVSASSTATLRVNGANSAITCTLTASTAGAFSDTAHTVVVGPNDDVDVQITTGATGTSMGVAMIVLYYDIFGPTRISLERIYKWHLQARASLSRIYKYNIQGRISLSRIYKWHLQARASLSRIYKWNIEEALERISKSQIYKWHLQARISLSQIYKYHIVGRISLSRIYLWNIIGRISLSRIYKYNIVGRVSLMRSYLYNIVGRVSLSRAYLYNVLGRISLSRIYKYNLQSRVSLSSILKYNIQSRISLSRIYKYHIQSRVSLSRIYLYNILSRVSLSRNYLYNIIGRVSLTRIYRYHMLGRISLAQIYKWHIQARVSLSRIYKYNIIGRISLARTYLWNILAEEGLERISKEQIYKWHIQARISLARVLKYDVLGRVSLTRIYRYHMLERISLSRVYLYNLIGRVQLTRIYKYNLTGRISLLRTYKYNIANTVSLARVYKYHITSRVSQSSIFKWNLLKRVSSSKTLRWAIGLVEIVRTETITGFTESKKKYQIPFDKWRSYLHRPQPTKGRRRSHHTRG